MTRQDVNEIPTQEDDTKQDVPKKRSKTNETQEIVYKLKVNCFISYIIVKLIELSRFFEDLQQRAGIATRI